MKTTATLQLIFCLFALVSFGQHTHEGTEHHFASKGLSVLERDLGFQEEDYMDANKLKIVNESYQKFHGDIEKIINDGIELSDEEFNELYRKLVVEVSVSLHDSKSLLFGEESKLFNGPCENMDYESGDFTGWTLTTGDVSGGAPYSFVGEVPVAPGIFHNVNGPGLDPVTGISQVNPISGNFSAMLGDGIGIGAKAARLKQTFLVDSTNYVFTYSYAVVFQSPVGHNLNQLPYFTVRVLDSAGNSIPCGEYMVIADAANAPDYQTTNWVNPINGSFSVVLYKDWSTVFTNLSAYIGQNVTIEFTAGDCSLTGHFGYAYVDASCGFEQLTATNNIICPGDSSLLSAPAGAASYLWSNGATTQSTTVYTGGTYNCTITPFQGGACDLVLDITITENPIPIADFSFNAVNCVGDSTYFSDLSNIQLPGSFVGYQWDFGDGIITPLSIGSITGTAQTNGTYTAPTHLYSAPGNFNVTLLIQSADGCFDSITKQISVGIPPVVDAGPDQTVCEGESVTLSGSGANNYTWDQGVTDGLPFIQPVGTITYTVIGSDLVGCSSSDQVNITVNPTPIVDAGIDIVGCQGMTVVLNGIGALNYVWNNGITNGVAFQPAVGTEIYTVIGTDANGCLAEDSVTITIYNLPIVSATDAEICEGDSVVLQANGTEDYFWTNGVENGIPFYPTESGMYTVIGIDTNGCQASDSAYVTVNSTPEANFTVLNLNLTTSFSTTGFDNLTIGAVTYSWDFGDGSPLSTEFEPEHTYPYTESGEYEIILTAFSDAGCPSEAIKYVHVFQDYIIYVPNAFTPDGSGVNEIFKPEMEGFDEDEYTLYIFNRWGQLIFESHNIGVGWDGKFAGQNYDTQDGVYTWKIIAGLKDSADTKIFVGHVSLLK